MSNNLMEVVCMGELDYDGSQLHHAFAYEQKKVLGPTISYFIGGCAVKEHLVDLEDSLADDFIKSERMAHFIIEIPEAPIRETVVWQRFFIRQIARRLQNDVYYDSCTLTINGDDIMVNGLKLSVSIATLSRFSGLIHVGINITVGEGCPVAAIGLKDFDALNINNYPNEAHWAGRVACEFATEYTDIVNATYKVVEVK